MDTFDRFCLVVGGVSTPTKASSVDANALTQRYPDSEFALVVEGPAGKLRSLPMSSLEQVKESSELLQTLVAAEVLPLRMVKQASERLGEQRERLQKGEGGWPSTASLFWDDAEDGFFWRTREQQHAAKTSSPVQEAPALASFSVKHRTVTLRKLSDIQDADRFLRTDGDRLSSSECRGVAAAIVTATAALGKMSEAEAMQKASALVRAYLGTELRPEAAYILRGYAEEVRSGASDLLGTSAIEKTASAYEALAAQLEKSSESMNGVELATEVSKLNQAVGLRPHAHRDLLLGAGETSFFKRAEDEGYEYTFGSTMVRASEIEALPQVNLRPLARFLPEKTVDALRETPLETFRGMPPVQKRMVARFVEETIKIREMNRSNPALI